MPYTSARLAYSIGSPTGVPVPCASTMPTVAASTPAAANAARYDRDLRVPRRCRDVHGVAVLVGGRAAHHGQDPVAVPQRVRQALEQHHGAPLGPTRTRPPRRRTHGSARSATACPAPTRDAYFRGSSITVAPPASARSLSPSCRLRQARCTASRPDEHAVSTVTRGTVQPRGRRRSARTPC